MGDRKKRMRCLSYRAASTSVSSTTAGDPHLEALIEEVKKYPCLYNINSLQYRDQYRKEECWNEISRILHSSCGDLKKEWKRLRDGYRQALVTRKKEIKKKVLKPWKYEEQMDFLKPYICPKSRLLVNARSASSDNEFEYFPMIKKEIISDDDSSQQSAEEQPSIVSEYLIRNTIRNIKPDPDAPPPPPTVEGKKRKKKVKVICKPRKRVASACASRPEQNGSPMPSVGEVGSDEILQVAKNGNMPSTNVSGNNGPDGKSTEPGTRSSNNDDAGTSNNNPGDSGNPPSTIKFHMVLTSEKLADDDSCVEKPNNDRVVPSTSNNGNTPLASNNVRTPLKSNGGKNINNSSTSNVDNNGSSSESSSSDDSGSSSSSSDNDNNDTTPLTSNIPSLGKNGCTTSTSNASNNTITASLINAGNDDGAPSTSNAGNNVSTPSNTNKGSTPPLSNALNNNSTQVSSSACGNSSTQLPKSIVNNGVATSSNSAGIQGMSSRFARNFANCATGRSASTNQPNDSAYIVFVRVNQNHTGNNEPNNESSRCYRIQEFHSGQQPTNRGGNNGGPYNHVASMRVSVPVNLRTHDQVYEARQRSNGNSPSRINDQQLSALQLFLASIYQTVRQLPLMSQNNVKSYILEFLKVADEEFEEMKANLAASARNNPPKQGQPANNRANPPENRGTVQSAVRFLGDNDARHAHLQLFLASIHESVRNMPGYLKSFMKINILETVTKVEASYRASRAH